MWLNKLGRFFYWSLKMSGNENCIICFLFTFSDLFQCFSPNDCVRVCLQYVQVQIYYGYSTVMLAEILQSHPSQQWPAVMTHLVSIRDPPHIRDPPTPAHRTGSACCDQKDLVLFEPHDEKNLWYLAVIILRIYLATTHYYSICCHDNNIIYAVCTRTVFYYSYPIGKIG